MPFSLIKYLSAGLILLFAACSGNQQKETVEQGPLLAKVHNKSLYFSELEGMFPDGVSAEDSLSILRAYTQRWIRDALLLHEAEKNIPSDLNIDKLVRDYRASLIRHNYEKVLVEEAFDSTISQEELIEFYEENKEQYQLETPIARCYFIKVPLPVPDSDELRRLWNSDRAEDFEKILSYCNAHAEAYLLEEEAWYKVEDIAQQMPNGTITIDNISAKRDFSQRDNNHQYYFRVFEVKKRTDIAPLSYIAEQARKVILRGRREKKLQEKIEAMYEEELRRNNIQTYY
jgi:hypothetical protein